jgi:hypothetical protein
MNDEQDKELRRIFAQQRRYDHENAPAWRPELLNRPVVRQHGSIRWIPAAFATACIVVVASFLAAPTTQPVRLSELPPLFDSPSAELFAHVEPPLLAFEAPSDVLLPQHLNHSIP